MESQERADLLNSITSNPNLFLAASGPLTIALFCCSVALLFALPAGCAPTGCSGSWNEGRMAWLTAVERFVLGVVMPPVSCWAR